MFPLPSPRSCQGVVVVVVGFIEQRLCQLFGSGKAIVKIFAFALDQWLILDGSIQNVVHIKGTDGTINGIAERKQKGSGAVLPNLVVMPGQ